MSSSESDALLQTRRKPNGPSWFAALSVGVVGVVAITSGAKSGFKAYQSRSSLANGKTARLPFTMMLPGATRVLW